ncbi:hypothetical protein [Paraburkholderia acidisoli]|uniref:Uncharacterized protein n=1 Tax=Paraburkholderia acidisoli TaxID=2571748 RepID=A0A7Z2JJ66_9BURK|nr:hypothetical protein [Paraburkholderia acidisoli]QGZ66486.1 hypothetical protein FAZ98_32435 [Paraburkholderia acidisoli]
MKFRGPLDEPPVSETDIQAYSDGTLVGSRAAQVRHYLAKRPGEWHRILFYRRLNEQMRDAYPEPRARRASRAAGFGEDSYGGPDDGSQGGVHGGSFGDSSDETRGASRPGSQSSSRRRAKRYIAVALAAAVLAGAAIAWISVSEPNQQVLNDAAVMALMDAENAGNAQTTPGAPALPAPFDLGAAGLRYIGSSEMNLGRFARAQRYLYENAEGERVVLLGARAWLDGSAPQWSAHRAGQLRLLMWRDDGTRWVLAGHAATRGLMHAADIATMPTMPPHEGAQ